MLYKLSEDNREYIYEWIKFKKVKLHPLKIWELDLYTKLGDISIYLFNSMKINLDKIIIEIIVYFLTDSFFYKTS